MNTVKILVHKELATTFNSWSIYIGIPCFSVFADFFHGFPVIIFYTSDRPI